MARLVSSSAGFVSVKPVVDSEILNDVFRYQILYNTTITQLKTFLDLYTQGSFHELSEVFTETELRRLIDSNRDKNFFNEDISNLVNFKYDPKVFVKYRSTIYSLLTGFAKTVDEHKKLESATTEIMKNNELLSSKEALIEYIKTQLQDTMVMNSFRVSQTYNVTTILKPWYSKYLELYGAPNDGIFDVEKMAIVVELLIQTNVITIEDFIENRNPIK